MQLDDKECLSIIIVGMRVWEPMITRECEPAVPVVETDGFISPGCNAIERVPANSAVAKAARA